jgi:hypothetical protein
MLNLETIIPSNMEFTMEIRNPWISKFPFLRKWLKPKKRLISIPSASFAQSQLLTQKYIEFVQLTVKAEEFTAEVVTKQIEMMLDVIVTAVKPGMSDVTVELFTDNLTPEQIGELFTYVSQPIQDKILKNAHSLQSLQKK